jgi:hypothetical protein
LHLLQTSFVRWKRRGISSIFLSNCLASTKQECSRYRMNYLKLTPQSKSDRNAFRSLLQSVQIMSRIFPGVWAVNADISISFQRISALDTLATANSLLVQDVKNTSDKLSLEELISSLALWIPTMCTGEQMDIMSTAASTSTTEFSDLPLSASWQSTDQFRLSLRCVATTWPSREMCLFGNPHQLRRRVGPAFYGLALL